MSFFCLLWVPLLYLLRRTVSPVKGGGYLWALLTGCVFTVLQFFIGPAVPPGGFGFSRWLSGFIDIVGFPVLIPLAVCCLLIRLGTLPRDTDYGNFALLCLIPMGVYRSISWISPAHPEFLVAVPLLWVAQVVGIAYFLGLIAQHSRWYVITVLVMGIVALPIAAATSWWAFYCQRPLLGLLLLVASIIPATVSLVRDFLHKERNRSKIWN
jgi:hypothetical protein